MTYQCRSLILVLALMIFVLVLCSQLPAQLVAPKVCLYECCCLCLTGVSDACTCTITSFLTNVTTVVAAG